MFVSVTHPLPSDIFYPKQAVTRWLKSDPLVAFPVIHWSDILLVTGRLNTTFSAGGWAERDGMYSDLFLM